MGSILGAVGYLNEFLGFFLGEMEVGNGDGGWVIGIGLVGIDGRMGGLVGYVDDF